jgi:hypothetical protein
LIGSSFAPYIPADRKKDAEDAFRTLVATGRYEGEFPLRAADGTVLELECRTIGNFVPGLHHCIARDVRERFQLQLQQTAKLESLGVVASGIAHDFNNLLVGILGNASLMREHVADSLSKALAEDVISAAERAAQLTRQLLAYAGKESLQTTTVALNSLTEQTVPLIRMSIPKTVALNLQLKEDLPFVEVDQTQIQQVVMNLVINAAEAIPTDNWARSRWKPPLDGSITGCRERDFLPGYTRCGVTGVDSVGHGIRDVIGSPTEDIRTVLYDQVRRSRFGSDGRSGHRPIASRHGHPEERSWGGRDLWRAVTGRDACETRDEGGKRQSGRLRCRHGSRR